MSEKKKIRALGTISTNATQDPFLLCLHFLYFYMITGVGAALVHIGITQYEIISLQSNINPQNQPDNLTPPTNTDGASSSDETQQNNPISEPTNEQSSNEDDSLPW